MYLNQGITPNVQMSMKINDRRLKDTWVSLTIYSINHASNYMYAVCETANGHNLVIYCAYLQF